MAIALNVSNLRKTYGKIEVVKGLSFEINSGEIFGFLGPNGAGKTTSIRMMIGEISPDCGDIQIFSKKMPADRQEIKQTIGVVPDYQNLYDRLTVRQNLELFCQLQDLPLSRIDEVLELVVLKDHQSKPCKALSRGLRQRTLIARGILHKPKLFFLDEPTSALDPQSAHLIRELVKKLRDEGTTVLITTHYMEEANSLCDRICIMHKGEIIALDTPENLKKSYGKNSILIECSVDNSSKTETLELPMNEETTASKLSQLMKEKRILKIHSQEATLEEVFINLTGAAWKEDGEIQ